MIVWFPLPPEYTLSVSPQVSLTGNQKEEFSENTNANDSTDMLLELQKCLVKTSTIRNMFLH